MILVKQNKNKLVIKGHSNYSDDNDIVCASFSSILYTSLNSMLEVDEKSIFFKDKNEVMTIEVINDNEITLKLFKVLIKLILNLEKEYPKNISYEREDN